jgi:hypothetical protein
MEDVARRYGRGKEWSCGKLGEFGGAVAQLGARLDGIEEVVGSNPIGSTSFSFSFQSDSKNFKGH